MFSFTRLRSSDLLGFIRAGRHESSQRVEKAIQPSSRLDALVFPLFLTTLLALTIPSRLAATSGAAEGDEVAIRAANPATMPSDTDPRFASASENLTGEESKEAEAFTASPASRAVIDPANSVDKSDNQAIHPVPSLKCMIFHETLCQALKNRPIVVLATLQTAMLVSDGVTTRQFLRRGYVEVDPITRILIGTKPTWARMVPLGAVQVVAGMWLAERMSISRHLWIRRFWWLPQIVGIAGNAAATGHNFTLH
jgi:hypothetical protein